MLWLSDLNENNVKQVKKITQDILSMFQVTVSQPTGLVPVNRTCPAPEKTTHGWVKVIILYTKENVMYYATLPNINYMEFAIVSV